MKRTDIKMKFMVCIQSYDIIVDAFTRTLLLYIYTKTRRSLLNILFIRYSKCNIEHHHVKKEKKSKSINLSHTENRKNCYSQMNTEKYLVNHFDEII